MTRVNGVSDAEAGFIRRSIFKAGERRLGAVPEPLRLMAHSSGVMWASGLFELAIGRARAVDPTLADLASLKVASMVGCVF